MRSFFSVSQLRPQKKKTRTIIMPKTFLRLAVFLFIFLSVRRYEVLPVSEGCSVNDSCFAMFVNTDCFVKTKIKQVKINEHQVVS